MQIKRGNPGGWLGNHGGWLISSVVAEGQGKEMGFDQSGPCYLGSAMVIRLIPLFLAILCLMLLAGCMEGEKSTTPADPEPKGNRLLRPDGLPAAGALVSFYPVDHDPGPELVKAVPGRVLQTHADSKGSYRTDSVPVGVYNIRVEDGLLASFRPSVTLPAAGPMPPDTLWPSGSLKGRLEILRAYSPGGIRIALAGTGHYALTDSQGRFAIQNIAQGVYSVRASLPDSNFAFRPLSVTVRAGAAESASVVLEYRGKAVGAVFLPDGRPAAYAGVIFCPVGREPSPLGGEEGLYKLQADSAGRYRFDSLPAGIYSVLAWPEDTVPGGGGGFWNYGSYRDSLEVLTGSSILSIDTARPVGSLVARMRLQPQQEHGKVAVHVLGTSMGPYRPDTAGWFALGGVPGGRYRVRISSSEPGYIPLIRTVEVRPARLDTLEEVLRPVFTGVPVVTGLEVAAYDTVNCVARLRWPRSDWPLLDRYIVHRDRSTGFVIDNPTPIASIRDTSYVDTIFKVDPATGRLAGANGNDSLAAYFEYRVSLAGSDGRLGLAWGGIIFKAPSPFFVRTGFLFRGFNITTGKEMFGDPIRGGDSLRIDGTHRNPTRKTVRLQVFLGDTTGTALMDTAFAAPLSEGPFSLKLKAPATAGAHHLVARARDEAGSTWWDKWVFQVF